MVNNNFLLLFCFVTTLIVGMRGVYIPGQIKTHLFSGMHVLSLLDSTVIVACSQVNGADDMICVLSEEGCRDVLLFENIIFTIHRMKSYDITVELLSATRGL